MAIKTQHRQTITVEVENWGKYCFFKGRYLRDLGQPEIRFTEFANACMKLHNLTIEEILQLRKNKKENKKKDRGTSSTSP